jgi:hypothetical protein
MTPLFTKYESGSSEYELKEYGTETFFLKYEKDSGNLLCQTEFENYMPRRKSFIPCPFCKNGNPVLTFSHSTFCGTNTSGGTEATYYEVSCLSCKMFSVFEHESVSYPYD